MKEKVNPNHHMGKTTGYELIDGVYHIAPLYREQFDALFHKKRGLEEMLKMVESHVATDLEQISRATNSVWKVLAEDIGLDAKKEWQYQNGTVKSDT